jgi:outer membrane biosynthesis protein TonB
LPEKSGQTISVTNPVLFVLTHMAEDTPNTQPSQPAQNPQNPQQPRRDAPRHQGSRRHHNYRNQAPRPAEKPAEKPQESKDLSLEDEETEQDRSAAPSRQSRGGGRGKPPKRVIEEWASDIYCE